MTKEKISYLESIKTSKFDFSNVDKDELLNLLLEHIGDQNPYVRDDLVYKILAHLYYDKIFDENILEENVKRLASCEYLTFDIENSHQYSVLKRSFTILQLVSLIHVHIRDKVIDKTIISNIFEKFLEYFSKEEVLIGYEQPVGWIHTVVHSADLMKTMMQIPWFHQKEIIKMFDVIKLKMKNHRHLFNFNEDERIADALKVGLERGVLSDDYVIKWMDEFSQVNQIYPLPDDIIIKKNIKQVLRSLYFKCLKTESLNMITKKLESLLT